MTLRLGQLLYTSFPNVGFHIVTSPEVPAEARQAFVQKVTHQLWDAYNPPDNGYRAVYIYQEGLDWTLFAWLYNDGADDRGRSHVPYFVGHYLAGPLSPEQLDNIFALLRKGPSMAIVRQAPPEYLEEAAAPDLWDYKPARAGVAVPAKICEQAYKALAEGKCVEIFVSGNDEEYGSDAHTALSNLSSSLMIRDTDQEPGVFANDPKGESLWKKSISPAFILGVLFTGVTCGLLGYSLQPKQSLVQEIITKAEVPNSIPAPDSNRIKKDLSNSQPAIDKSKSLSEIAVASNSLPPSQRTTARNNPKTSSSVDGKGTPNLSSLAKPSSALPRSPQASPTTKQLPARVRSLPTQKSVPKTSNPPEALANDQEADKLIAQKSSQAPEVEHKKQGNVTPAAIPIRLIPISSTEKTLESIEIPMQDGTSVPANKLLHLDTVAWKLDKGKTRKKLVVLVNELMESKNLNSACKKANVSLDSLRLLIKKYGNA